MSSNIYFSTFHLLRSPRFIRCLNVSRCISSKSCWLKSKKEETNIGSENFSNSKLNEINGEKVDPLSVSNTLKFDQTSNFSDSNSNQGENNIFSDDDINAQILNVALQYVPKYGWTVTNIDEAVKELDLSVSAAGIFKRGGTDLVLHFIEECNSSLSMQLASIAKNRSVDNKMSQAEFIEFAIKTRLQMIIPYIDSWPQAMKLMASPIAAPECIQLGAHLMDEIWYYAGDTSTDMSWYSKRATLSAIYIATEIYLLNDRSKDFVNTWTFLHNRMKEVKNLEKFKHSFEEFLSGTFSFFCAGITTAQNIIGINNKSNR
ncbi:ubiquinone biosynthesis protein COQ9-B, mitochondrial [Hydra vulgaris]|uniref:Ubiquinone biosynthesis protein n=1 Tax=Hydra vulgaris TaxID=6087 RepID=A0ABM4BSS1_HYDVU